MEQQARRPTTAKEQHWLDHITRAHQSTQPLSHYAKTNGLDAKTLYRWQSILRQRGWLEATEAVSKNSTSSDWLPVRIETATLTPWRVVFPNGLSVEVTPPQTCEQRAELFSVLSTLT